MNKGVMKLLFVGVCVFVPLYIIMVRVTKQPLKTLGVFMIAFVGFGFIFGVVMLAEKIFGNTE